MDEACLLLAEYNGRLAAELEDRRQLARMLTDYISSQKDALGEREKKLEVCSWTCDCTEMYGYICLGKYQLKKYGLMIKNKWYRMKFSGQVTQIEYLSVQQLL